MLLQILGMMSELGLNDSHDPYTDSSSSSTARYTAATAAAAGGAYDGTSSSNSNTTYQFAAVRGGSSSSGNNNSNWAPSLLHELTLSTSEGPNSNESVEMAQYVSEHMYSTGFLCTTLCMCIAFSVGNVRCHARCYNHFSTFINGFVNQSRLYL